MLHNQTCLLHKYFNRSKLSTDLGAMLSFLAIVKNVNTNAQKIVDNNHHNAVEKSLTLQIRRENRLSCGMTSDLNAHSILKVRKHCIICNKYCLTDCAVFIDIPKSCVTAKYEVTDLPIILSN